MGSLQFVSSTFLKTHKIAAIVLHTLVYNKKVPNCPQPSVYDSAATIARTKCSLEIGFATIARTKCSLEIGFATIVQGNIVLRLALQPLCKQL